MVWIWIYSKPSQIFILWKWMRFQNSSLLFSYYDRTRSHFFFKKRISCLGSWVDNLKKIILLYIRKLLNIPNILLCLIRSVVQINDSESLLASFKFFWSYEFSHVLLEVFWNCFPYLWKNDNITKMLIVKRK